MLVTAAAVQLLSAAAFATYPGSNGKLSFTRYDGAREIWVMNPDGTGSARLLERGDQSSWSPDGSKIAFSCNEPSDSVCVAPADGSSVHQVPNPSGAGPGPDPVPWPQEHPTWSPNGQHLAISSIGECGDFCSYFRIWRIDAADGGDPILMADQGVEPTWSQNRRIAFQSYSSAPYEIHTVPDFAPGTSNPLVPAAYGYSPDWSPDGNRIVFTDGQFDGADLFVVNADGSGQTRLTNTPATETDPAWSPDGTRIAFVRDYDDLYLINPDGTGEVRLTATPTVQEFEPAWQPRPWTGYPRPAAATPIRVSLVPAFQRCTNPNRAHGTPLDHASCAPPDHDVGYMTMGPSSSGFVRLAARMDTPAPGNQGDVEIRVRLRDARRVVDNADALGSIEVQTPVRITDKQSSPDDSVPATVQDVSLKVRVPCNGTTDTAIGSTCSLNTTTNALLPDFGLPVLGGKRTIWQLGQISVLEGGEDGNIETPGDNGTLAVQGVFVP
jgi:hypothetical protein